MTDWTCDTNFPNGTFFKKNEGTDVEVNGFNFRLVRVMREYYLGAYGGYVVFFEGKPVTNSGIKDEAVVLKFRYEMMDPWGKNTERPTFICRERYSWDYQALQSLGDSGYIPKYIAHGEGVQSVHGPYPGGYVLIVVMTKLEGIPIKSIESSEELSSDEIRSIKSQMVESLKYFRKMQWSVSYGPEDIFYNREKKHMFYLGLTRLEPDPDPDSPEFHYPIDESLLNRMFLDSLPPEWGGRF